MKFDWDRFKRGEIVLRFMTEKAYNDFVEFCLEKGIRWVGGCYPENVPYNHIGCGIWIRYEKGLCCSPISLYLDKKYEVITLFEFSEEEADINYRDNIVSLLDRQREKGIKKYGETLEENTTLSTEQRIEHLEEELIDGLEYCEHLKRTFCDSLSANDYQRMAMRTAGDKSENYLDNAIMGLCGEVGECADIVKKHHFQGHDLDREKLKDELSDVCWYVALLATALGLTLEEVMLHNIEKLKKRYPDGFDKSRSINRDKVTN